VIKNTTYAYVVFALAMTVEAVNLLLAGRFSTVVAICGLSALGFVLRGRSYFWKVCLLFFGLMSVLLAFRVFGGLEPNSPGALSSGDWLSVVAFGLSVAALFAALFVGLKVQARHS
jgi:hypothetical protein